MEKINVKNIRKKVIKKEAVNTQETAYDILCKNFELAGRITFLHRLVYIGYHNFCTSDSYDEIINFFSYTINKTNQQDGGFEKLTGYLIVYPKHFIHLIEGDEDIIHIHLKYLFEHENYDKKFGQIKLLTMIAHINRRSINDWGYYYGIPPTLSETAAKSEMSLTQITINCVLKIYNLVNQIVNEYDGTSKLRSDRLNVSSKTQESPDLTLSFHGIGIGTGQLCRLNKNNNFGCFLPEIELLDPILESNRTINLMDYFQNSRHVPQRNLEKDNVWPVPTDFIPFDVFDKVYDTITVLPKPTILMGKNNEDE